MLYLDVLNTPSITFDSWKLKLDQNLGEMLQPSAPNFGYEDELEYSDYTLSGQYKRFVLITFNNVNFL